jgi:hypothetical protein
MNPNARGRLMRHRWLARIAVCLAIAAARPAAAQPAPPGALTAWSGYHQSVRLTWSAPELAGSARASITRAEWGALRGVVSSKAAIANDAIGTEGDAIEIAPQDRSAPARGVLTYRLYRAAQIEGPFAIIADGISSSWYRDGDVENGRSYAYRVTAVSDGQESAPSDIATATPAYGGWRILSGYTKTAPSIDGFIDAGEWSDAAVVDITAPYDPTLEPVVAYVMNSDTRLFIAVRDPNIPFPDEFNQIGIYFEQSARGRWNPIPTQPEGNIWIIYDSIWDETTNWFRAIGGDWPATILADYGPVDGVEQDVGFLSGYHEFEVAIDLADVPLVSAPGRVIALALYSDQTGYAPYSGDWPSGIMQTEEYFAAPVLYGDVALGGPAGAPVVLPAEGSDGANLAVFPNPVRGAATFALTRAGAIGRDAQGAAVEIFDASGRRIAAVPFSRASGLWHWDGRAGDGAELPQGVYFFRLVGSRSDGAASSAVADARTGRLTLLR